MKPFHINQGNLFAQPYESSHARLRRCLISNPGIPLSTLTINMQLLNPELAQTLDADYSLKQHHLPTWLFYGDQATCHRQCPQCARLFYHTDIYALPWLTHCPIHHCPLTDTCPTCYLPWPDSAALPKRECPTCGRPALNDIQAPIRPAINNLHHEPIGAIYHFLRLDELHETVHLHGYHPRHSIADDWWTILNCKDSHFPACLLPQRAEMTRAALRALHITIRPIRQQSSPIMPLCKDDFKLGTLGRFSDEHFLWVFQVMKRIIRWIEYQTQSPHTLHIENYWNARLNKFLTRPDHCPYCMALSQWFFNIAWDMHRTFEQPRDKSYLFIPGDSFFDDYYAREPYVTINHRRNFVMNKKFTGWFFRRGLEISFMHLLRRSFHLYDQIMAYRYHDEELVYVHYRFEPILTDRYCYISIVNDCLHFFYKHEHPLNYYAPHAIPELNNKCREYHCHMDSLRTACHQTFPTEPRAIEFKPIHTEHDFIYSDYKELLQCFRRCFNFETPARRKHQLQPLMLPKTPTYTFERLKLS